MVRRFMWELRRLMQSRASDFGVFCRRGTGDEGHNWTVSDTVAERVNDFTVLLLEHWNARMDYSHYRIEFIHLTEDDTRRGRRGGGEGGGARCRAAGGPSYPSPTRTAATNRARRARRRAGRHARRRARRRCGLARGGACGGGGGGGGDRGYSKHPLLWDPERSRQGCPGRQKRGCREGRSTIAAP